MTQRTNYAAAAPGGMKALGSVYGYVSQSGLPATLIDLVYGMGQTLSRSSLRTATTITSTVAIAA